VAAVFRGRYTAQIHGPFVVFLIGRRINQLWKVWRWLPRERLLPEQRRAGCF
jgi:hypothetical protein